MDTKKPHDGPISLSLLSLQAQIKTLLAEAGGENVINLLDALCRMNINEQEIVLKIFTRIIDRFISGEVRLSEDQSELKNFEETLYSDLVSAMQEATSSKGSMKLEVLQGGKDQRSCCRSVVNINDLRKARQSSKRPTLN